MPQVFQDLPVKLDLRELLERGVIEESLELLVLLVLLDR